MNETDVVWTLNQVFVLCAIYQFIIAWENFRYLSQILGTLSNKSSCFQALTGNELLIPMHGMAIVKYVCH